MIKPRLNTAPEIIDALTAMASHIDFEGNAHVYDFNGHRVPSVSGVIGKFKPKFDEKFWSERNAQDEGVTPEELRKKWHEIRERACQRGSAIHDYIENMLLGLIVKTQEQVDSVNAYLEICTDLTIACECRIGNEMFCGTFDNLVFRDGRIGIKDWKTNRQMNFSGFPFLDPIRHIPGGQFWTYAIQLNLYRYLLPFEVDFMEIVWFPHTGGHHSYAVPVMDATIALIINALANDN